MSGLSQLYVIREGAPAGSAVAALGRAIGPMMREADWPTIERLYPEAGAMWDVDDVSGAFGEEPRLYLLGNTPVAVADLPEDIAVFSGERWEPVEVERKSTWIKVHRLSKAMLISQGSYGGDALPPRFIDLIGIEPSAVLGARPPEVPNGRVSAELRYEAINAQSLGAALMAVARGERTGS